MEPGLPDNRPPRDGDVAQGLSALSADTLSMPDESVVQKGFSDLVLEQQLITAERLAHARRVQEKLEHPLPLGEVLVQLKYISRTQLRALLQKAKRKIRIGDLMVEMGILSESQLRAALAQQKGRGIPLGKLLVEEGILTERHVLKVLCDQKDVPYLEPVYEMLDPALMRRVPFRFLRSNTTLPLTTDRQGRILLLVNFIPGKERLRMFEELFRAPVTYGIAPEDTILALLDRFEAESATGGAAMAVSHEDRIVRLVDYFIREAVEQRASDIHFEPVTSGLRIRYRIDGVLIARTTLPEEMRAKFLSRVKILSGADIAEKRHHQDGRFSLQVAGQDIDMRMSSYVTVHGENIVLRLLNSNTGLIALDELGMPRRTLSAYIDNVLSVPSGIVIAAGPTGSGKTTTLYSSLEYVNDIGVKIITAEDPVEYQIDGIMQCSINEKIDLTYSQTLRAIVRQDPDIILLGEIRDTESANAAIQAALTGHKVFTSLHAEDSVGALLRLMNMEIETFLLASTINCVLAQRLLRTCCPACRAPAAPEPRDLYLLGIRPDEILDADFHAGRGCAKCHFTGYSGRTGVFELLLMTPGVEEAILDGRSYSAIREISMQSADLVTMLEMGVARAMQGVTTLSEVIDSIPRGAHVRPVAEILEILGESTKERHA